jgi:hypothetical protein
MGLEEVQQLGKAPCPEAQARRASPPQPDETRDEDDHEAD